MKIIEEINLLVKKAEADGVVGPVKGIEDGGLFNEYLKQVPHDSGSPTKEQWDNAIDEYKRVMSNPVSGSFENGQAQELLSDMHNAAFWGVKPIDSHDANVKALKSWLNIVHNGVDGKKYGPKDQEGIRDSILDIASSQGNERFRDALYRGITNRLATVTYVPTYDDRRMKLFREPSYQRYLDKYVRSRSTGTARSGQTTPLR